MKKAPPYTFDIFLWYNAFRCIYILLTLKNKNKKISVHQLLYFRDMFLNGICLNFCKKARNVHFDLNSVFSFFCKISFADLWSLFMEHITFFYLLIFTDKELLDVITLPIIWFLKFSMPSLVTERCVLTYSGKLGGTF